MPKLPALGPGGPPPLLFGGGWPGVALVAIYAIGMVPCRYATATVGTAEVGRTIFPCGGLLAKKLINVTHNMAYPDTAHPCYAEVQKFADAIACRYPVRLKFMWKHQRHDISGRRMHRYDAAGRRVPGQLREKAEAEIFGGTVASLVLIYLGVAEVATAIQIAGLLQSSPSDVVMRAIHRFKDMGVVRSLERGSRGVYWALDRSFFAHRELRDLLRSLATHYRPEYFAYAAHAHARDVKVRMLVEGLQTPEFVDSLSVSPDSLSVSRE